VKKPAQLQNKSPRKTTEAFSGVLGSKISLALVLLAFGAFGALVGEKFMEKLGEWFKWFFLRAKIIWLKIANMLY